MRRAFSLTELMVAVGVLVIVIVATGRIFSVVSRVTSQGTAGASVLQEGAAIERQVREDFRRINSEGVLAIRFNSVPNNERGPGRPLLNPARPPQAMIRTDQVVFFMEGLQSSTTAALGASSSHKGQSTISRVYYGHAFQLPRAPAFNLAQNKAYDPNQTVTPWDDNGQVQMSTVQFAAGATSFARADAAAVSGVQPEARQWILARQPILLADDGGNETIFLSGTWGDGETQPQNRNIAGLSLFYRNPSSNVYYAQVQSGRVDMVAMHVDEMWDELSANGSLPWRSGSADSMYRRISDFNRLIYWPRAERQPPGPIRVDQALSNHVLGTACSSFRVDWTYDDGTGSAMNSDGVQYYGALVDPSAPQPWFGLVDVDDNGDGVDDVTGVRSFTNWSINVNPAPNALRTIDPFNIEDFPPNFGWSYAHAVFGFNPDKPFFNSQTNAPDEFVGAPATGAAFTPWPSALRITVVLHDPETRLENGREFQFIVRLAKRGE